MKPTHETRPGVQVEIGKAVDDSGHARVVIFDDDHSIWLLPRSADALFQPIEEPCEPECPAATTDFTESHVGERYREAGIREVIAWLRGRLRSDNRQAQGNR